MRCYRWCKRTVVEAAGGAKELWWKVLSAKKNYGHFVLTAVLTIVLLRHQLLWPELLSAASCLAHTCFRAVSSDSIQVPLKMKKWDKRRRKISVWSTGLISLYFHLHQVLSDQPGLELYSGNFLPAEVTRDTWVLCKIQCNVHCTVQCVAVHCSVYCSVRCTLYIIVYNVQCSPH